MLYYAVMFFIVALIAAVFGFTDLAAGAAGIARILFVLFLIGAVVTFFISLGRRAWGPQARQAAPRQALPAGGRARMKRQGEQPWKRL